MIFYTYKFILTILLIVILLVMAYQYKRKRTGGKPFSISDYIPYPYINLYLDISDMQQLFAEFVTSDLRPDVAGNDKVGLLKLSDGRQDRYNITRKFTAGNKWEVLTDYFQEDVRIRCNRRGKLSPYEMYIHPSSNKWASKYRRLVTKPISKKLYKTIATTFKKTVWNDCDLMAAGVVKSILDEFKPKSILMPTGGWGDAIIATMAYEQYTDEFEALVAVDPNDKAVANWQDMLVTYAGDTSKYTFIISPFQTAKLPDMVYDLIYSSPPYFISEEYTESPGQSWVDYNNIDAWFEGFMQPTFEKAWDKLRPGGHLVVIVNDVIIDSEEIFFVDRFHEVIDRLSSVYLYTWGFKKYIQQKNYQPIFIWEKL